MTLMILLMVTFKGFLQWFGPLLNVSDLSFFDDCDSFIKQRAATLVILWPVTMTYHWDLYVL